MDARAIDSIKHSLNTEVVRRLLIRYFLEKGFTESFDRLLCPTQLQDLTQVIPVLAPKLELVPHAVALDPQLGKAVLGWNLFVLGTHRMFLGETQHRDLQGLARQIQLGQIQLQEQGLGAARKMSTPRQVVNFVTRVLGRHDAGYTDLVPPQLPLNPQQRMGWSTGGAFYRKPGVG